MIKREKQEQAARHIRHAEEILSRKKFDITQIQMPKPAKSEKGEGAKKNKKLDPAKIKREREKEMIQRIKEKRDQRFEIAKVNAQSLKQDANEKYRYLQQKDNQRSKLIHEIKEALQEDVDQKKEISLLKKKDQVENYERGKNFH